MSSSPHPGIERDQFGRHQPARLGEEQRFNTRKPLRVKPVERAQREALLQRQPQRRALPDIAQCGQTLPAVAAIERQGGHDRDGRPWTGLTRRELIEKDPELIKALLKTHRLASEYAMKDREAFIAIAMQKLGQQKPSIEKAAPNVELTWNIDDQFMKQAEYYGGQMLSKKQIRQLPDYKTFIDASFVKALAAT